MVGEDMKTILVKMNEVDGHQRSYKVLDLENEVILSHIVQDRFQLIKNVQTIPSTSFANSFITMKEYHNSASTLNQTFFDGMTWMSQLIQTKSGVCCFKTFTQNKLWHLDTGSRFYILVGYEDGSV